MTVVSKLSEGVSSVIGAATGAGQVMTDKAISAAVASLLATMKCACVKIAKADEDLPEGTTLRVAANALLVELSLEIPVKAIRDGTLESREGT